MIRLSPDVVTPPERLVLFALAWHSDEHGLNSWPAVSTIARETSLGRRTIQKSLRQLADKHLIKFKSKAPRRSVRYDLNVRALNGARYVEPDDRACGAQSDDDDCAPQAQSGLDHRAPGAPHRAAGALHRAAAAHDCAPGAPDPSLNRPEPSLKKYPAATRPPAHAAHPDDQPQTAAAEAFDRLTAEGREQLENDARAELHLEGMPLVSPARRTTLIHDKVLEYLQDARVRQTFGVGQLTREQAAGAETPEQTEAER